MATNKDMLMNSKEFRDYYDFVSTLPTTLYIQDTLALYYGGDDTQLEILVNYYLKLVINVVMKFSSKIDESYLLDVIKDGNIALRLALQSSENKKDLESYLLKEIRQAIFTSIKAYKNNSLLPENSNVEGLTIDRDLLLVLKEIMNEEMYYVFYSLINGRSINEIAENLGISLQEVKAKYEDSLKILEKYKNKNSDEYKEIITRINKREGKKKSKLRLEPRYIELLEYLYLKKYLSVDELNLFYYTRIEKYIYTAEELRAILKFTSFKYISTNKSLCSKLEKHLSTEEFDTYKKQMIKKYGNNIYRLLNDSVLKDVDYDKVRRACENLDYQSLVDMLGENINLLSKSEIELLEKFFTTRLIDGYPDVEGIERDVNLNKFGFKKKANKIPPSRLYDSYLKHLDEFSEEQRLYLDCFFFRTKEKQLFRDKYPDSSLYYRSYFLIDRLERIYYGIYRILENNFNKDKYLLVKKNYPDKLTPERIRLLDLYYGVGDRRYTINEMAKMDGMDYIKMHDLVTDAREYAINLYANRGNKLEIDYSLYIPYLKDEYEYTDETRKILKMYLIERLSYDEISTKTGLTKYRISNIITDGIRKIDGYRFGISELESVNEADLNGVFELCKDSFDDLEKDILRCRFLKKMENKDIALKYQEQLKEKYEDENKGRKRKIENLKDALLEVNRTISRFNKLLFKYRVENISIDEEDVRREINRHISESVLNEKEKIVMSYFYGIPYLDNQKGEKLAVIDIAKKMDITLNACRHYYYSAIDNIKGRKKGILAPDLCFIERDKLDKLLDDPNLPISQKERDIICFLFELKGYPYKSFPEIVAMIGEGKGSVRRRYFRAIISIKKYLNGEVEKQIDYETDIVPLLKYFCIRDRMYIEDYYVNKLTYEQLSKKYDVTFDKVYRAMGRIKINIYDLLHDSDAKRFDFDYYTEAIKDERLPFYGNLEVATEIFDLFFGMNGEERMGAPGIIEKLGLSIKSTSLNRCINLLMLTVCKLRDGFYKVKEFSMDEIGDYYFRNGQDMSYYHSIYYKRYFNRMANCKYINGIQSVISDYIKYDLIKENYDDCFKVSDIDSDQALVLLRNSDYKLTNRTRLALMSYFGIRYRDIMNGKEINHVYRIIDSLIKQNLITLCDEVKLKKDRKD